MNPSFHLPRDILESQLSSVDVLAAVFPELELPETTRDWLNEYRQGLETDQLQTLPESLSLTLTVNVDGGVSTIELNISVPFRSTSSDPSEPPPFIYNIRQPPWMSKANVVELQASMPKDDVLSAFEYLRDQACRFIKPPTSSSLPVEASSDGPVVRVWLYLPSLSTREKRADLVNYAPEYSLTGFVLAGKPGVLCLEGLSTSIDHYMKFIKTNSWGDIPSHQKKVSERYREVGQVERVFDGMQEITDVLGERGGKRANRSDMQALERWLNEKGLGSAFEKVIF